MAEAFATAFASTKWCGIYASPLSRTRATAEPLSRATGLAITTLDGLAEIDYGEWDGMSAEAVAARWPLEHERWRADPAWNPPEGGETAIALAQRATAAVETIREAHHDGDVLAVSHKATIRVLLCALLGVDVGRFRYRFGCPVGSVSIVEFGAHGPMAASVADRGHLSDALRHAAGT